MRLSRLSLLALVFVCAGPVHSADSSGDFVVKGAGATPCSQFISAAKEGGAEALSEYGGYVAGYTSAYNEMSPATYDVWAWQTMDTLMLLLLQRCRQSPDLNFGAAVMELTRYYSATRVANRETKRRVGSEASGLYLYESAYQKLLEALRREGYPTEDPYASMMQYKVDNKVMHTANVYQILLLRLIGAPAEQAH